MRGGTECTGDAADPAAAAAKDEEAALPSAALAFQAAVGAAANAVGAKAWITATGDGGGADGDGIPDAAAPQIRSAVRVVAAPARVRAPAARRSRLRPTARATVHAVRRRHTAAA